MIDDEDRAGMATLLAWWREMGVDGAIDASGDRLACARRHRAGRRTMRWWRRRMTSAGQRAWHRRPHRGPRPPPRRAVRSRRSAAGPGRETTAPARSAPDPVADAPRRFPTAAPDAAALAARDAAAQRSGSRRPARGAGRFDGCALKATAKNLCFYRGNPKARLMIIGEAPGRDEDLQGKPFVGRAGQLLDKMLAAIGLGEDDVHITNIVYWRPPGNRTPTPQEAQVCRPFLERQIELVAPDILMTMGGSAATRCSTWKAASCACAAAGGISRRAGARCRRMPTLHPAYLLRTPVAKRLAWRDLLAIQERLRAAQAT